MRSDIPSIYTHSDAGCVVRMVSIIIIQIDSGVEIILKRGARPAPFITTLFVLPFHIVYGWLLCFCLISSGRRPGQHRGSDLLTIILRRPANILTVTENEFCFTVVPEITGLCD